MKYESEEEIRKDFARLFDWYNYENENGYSQGKKVLKKPEWAEIFSKVGKLLQLEDTAGNNPVLQAMCRQLENMENVVTKFIEKK